MHQTTKKKKNRNKKGITNFDQERKNTNRTIIYITIVSQSCPKFCDINSFIVHRKAGYNIEFQPATFTAGSFENANLELNISFKIKACNLIQNV